MSKANEAGIQHIDSHEQEQVNEKVQFGHNEVLRDEELLNEAYRAENHEHQMGTWEAAKTHPMACLWAFLMAFTIVMESFDMFLVGNFTALPAFKERFGVFLPGTGYVIETKWQSALFQAGQCGAFVGVCSAGMVTNRLGYKWTTLWALVGMIATIFISFFATSLSVLTVGQFFEGIPWGFFIANSPAYASEVVPLALRGLATSTLQMSWSIGGIIVAAVTYHFNQRNDEWAYRIPLALQWIFPVPLLVILFFAPESPYWLARKGRTEEAMRSVQRLNGSSKQDPRDVLAMIERTVEIEAKLGGNPSYFDLFRGTDLRRTLITCFAYASQNFAGNLIANQATFFFEQAGMSTNFSFQLGLINSCLGFVANAIAFVLTAHFGRRTIFLYGLGFNIIALMALGVAASVNQSSATSYAQACLGVIISFNYAMSQGPITYTIIAETSSVRLRALSTGVGRGAYYICEIPCIYLASQLLNPTGWNVAGKCGFVWGGTACVCFVIGYFFLPELKHRSYRELDILFKRKVPARKFKSTEIDVAENE